MKMNANVWLRMSLSSMIFPECPLCRLSAAVSVASEVSLSTKSYSAALTVESLSLTFGNMLQTFKIGQGFGAWRLNNSISSSDNICEPSGIFVNGVVMLEAPLIDKILNTYLKMNYSIRASADVFMQFRTSDGVKASGVRGVLFIILQLIFV
jgi:hypothetical protein